MFLKYERRYGKVIEKGTVPLPWWAGALLRPVIWLIVRSQKLSLTLHLNHIALSDEW